MITSSRRAGVVVVGLAFASAGCFALFSLDEYGPVDDPAPDGSAGDVIVADVVIGDGTVVPPILPGRIVFVTSTTQSGALDGSAAGDEICQDLATNAGLKGTFKAWLSDQTTSPKERFARFTLDGGDPNLWYVSADRRTLITSSFLELQATGSPRAPISMTEKKLELAVAAPPAKDKLDCNPVPQGVEMVWTATSQAGEHSGQNNGNNADCVRWSQGVDQANGFAGAIIRLDGGNLNGREWTTACVIPCSMGARLYCFEQ